MNTINWDNENEELINEHATSEVSDELTNKVNAILENDDMLMIKNMPLENFDDFIDFNDKANASLSAYLIIIYWLEAYGENFTDSFRRSNISVFRWWESDTVKLMEMIDIKNTLYRNLLLDMISKSKINMSQEDLDDIKNLINCWIFNFFDEQYKVYHESINWNEDKDYGWLNYWMPWERGIVGYWESCKKKEISKEFLSLNNKNIRKYIADIVWLSWKNDYSYSKWIDAERSELANWQSDSQIVMISPMENYMHKNFIDPEFWIFLRSSTWEDSAKVWSLCTKHYWEEYWIGKVNVFFVEPLLLSWDLSYSQFLGKNFPNDATLRSEIWIFIWVVKWRFPKTFDEYLPMISKIFNTDVERLKSKRDSIVAWALKETTYHEYGHNIFETKDTLLEEAKASLFYWLHLYEEYCLWTKNLDKNIAQDVLDSFVVDFTRYISRFDKSQFRKYVITSEILLHHLIDRWLVIYNKDNNNLSININNEESAQGFKDLLIDLKRILDKIKDIYDSWELYKTDKIVAYYDEKTLPIIKELFKNFD